MHDHSHSNSTLSPEEVRALLKYNQDHNAHHAEELHELSHMLEEEGKREASALVHEASGLLSKASELIGEALEK